MALKLRAYILAGGKSARMGRDKAMLQLGGKSLLARAVDTLRLVNALRSHDGRVEVTICGERDALEGANRAILDRYPSCGPLGGIEAALNDLPANEDADWAFFIPVDMPLLSAAFIEELLHVWTTESSRDGTVRAFLVEIGGMPQPLVSLVHRSVLELAREALESGRYKVVPVLQSARTWYTSLDQEPLSQNQASASGSKDIVAGRHSDMQAASVDRLPTQIESVEATRSEYLFRESRDQFINVNNEADLIRVATLLKQRGSNNQPETPANELQVTRTDTHPESIKRSHVAP